jgi:lipocalin
MAHYSVKEGDVINILNSQQERKDGGGFKERTEPAPAEGTFRDDIKDARLKVRMAEQAPWGTYNVLATDYESYAVVAGCQYVWVLTRTPLNYVDEKHESEIARVT